MREGNRPAGRWREHLRRLAADASHSATSAWDEVRRYTARFERAVVSRDLAEAACNAGLAADQVALVRDVHWSPDLQAAMVRLGDHIPISEGALHYFSKNELMGWTNRLAGEVFEQTVAHLANTGHITLPDGADHVVLPLPGQEGWDLSLLHGSDVVGHAQVKFSDHADTIIRHLQNHSDVQIVIANHEAAAAAAHHGVHVIDSGVGYEGLHDHVASQVANHLGNAHLVHEWIPEVALVAILAIAARKLRNGEEPKSVADWTRAQLVKTGIANAVGTLVSLTPHGALVRLPAAMYTRFFMNRFDAARSAAARMHTHVDHLRRIRSVQTNGLFRDLP